MIDLLEFYGSALPAAPVGARVDIFVACNCLVDGLSRQLLAVDTSDEAHVVFGHYVIGRSCRSDAPLSIGPVGRGEALRPVCLRLGVAVLETQSMGDCGVDAMCFHRGEARTPAGFKRVRLDLARYMRSVAEDVNWQLCFQVCEGGVHNPEPPAGPTARSVVLTVEGKGSPLSQRQSVDLLAVDPLGAAELGAVPLLSSSDQAESARKGAAEGALPPS